MAATDPNLKLAKLDGLFGHLSACTGLYSKETFLSLYGCIIKMIRDHKMCGFVMTRTLGDEDFEPMAAALRDRPDLPLFCFEGEHDVPPQAGISPATGFLIVLTDRHCATLYWNVDARKSFQVYQGGWTFHPTDTKTVATHLIGHLSPTEERAELMALLEGTRVDRRYDDKLNILITSLVNGLENQSRELAMALQQVQELNKRMVEQERLAAIGQLCSVIAHEIRNPLGLIDLYAKLIETQVGQLELTETQQEKQDGLNKNIHLIRESIQSLESILSELTNYSRPLELSYTSIDIVKLVSDVCDFYRPSYDEKQVNLILNESSVAGLTLEIDTGRVRQALINLLKNALEISQSGHKVTVSVDSRRNDDKVYIKVRDQGPGVDPKARQKLFTPYFSTKRNGTGLGLAHSRKILQAHGGSVELLSTSAEEGSVFALILPKGKSHS